MKRESKGLKVKSFTDYVPQPDGTKAKTVVPVYFKADEGAFYIYVPDHIADAVGRHKEAPESYQPHARAVVAAKVDTVLAAFPAMGSLYRRILEAANRVKVIQVRFEANGLPHVHGRVVEPLSFASSPALALTFRVLWRVDDKLFSLSDNVDDGRVPHMTYIAAVPGPTKPGCRQSTFLLDWTEEREAFFKRMDLGMRTLAERIAEMLFGDTSANVDRLIASGGLALPAPAAAGDDA